MTRTHYRRGGGGARGRAVRHLVPMRSPENRFWLQLVPRYFREIMSPEEVRSVGPPKTDGCWEWQGAFDTRGYGRIAVDGKDVRAHRFAFELLHGPIPEGHHVLHKCGNWRCVRPDHLALGKTPVTHATGETSVNAKLTEAEVKEIRSRAAAGETMAKLAAGSGVSRTSIWRIINRETWADV